MLGKPALSAPLPEETRYQQAAQQPEPQLHGFKKALDIAGQIALPGVERFIPGTPGNYRRNLANLAGEAGLGNTVASAQLGRQEEEAKLGQTEAQTEKIKKMTPAEYAEMQARTGLLGAQTGETGQETRLTGEKADLIHNAVTALSDPNAEKNFEASLGKMTPDEQAVMSSAFKEAQASGSFAPLGAAVDKIYSERATSARTKAQIPPHITIMKDGQAHIMERDPSGAYSVDRGIAPPNYAAAVLPTKTTELTMPDGATHRMQWNPATNKYDIDLGVYATGAAAHAMFQAGRIEDVGPKLIQDINANRDILGKLNSYYTSWASGKPSPLATKDAARASQLLSELMSFAALQPALHGFRSHDAMEAFEKMIGGLEKTPDATIGSIQGILKTAGAFTNVKAPGRASTAAGNVARETGRSGQPVTMIGGDGKVYQIPADKVNQALKDGFRRQ